MQVYAEEKIEIQKGYQLDKGYGTGKKDKERSMEGNSEQI